MATIYNAQAWKPHSAKQDLAIFSEKPIIALCTGIQFGKTRAGAIRTKIEMHRHKDKSDTFLICAPTYKILNQSTLPAFLEIMDGYGEYKKGDAVFEMNGGGKCFMRTATDPDSIVGMTNVRFVWGDEAGKYPLYFWQNMQARAAFKRAPIMLTTSPYALNWLYKELIRPKMKDENARPDIELIQARSDENPYFPLEIYEKNRANMDPRMFNQIFGGKFEKMEGLVYDCFDERIHLCDPIGFPVGTRIVAGVDWGYINPFAMVVRAITPEGDHYDIAEVYQTGLTISRMVETARLMQDQLKIETFYCDPSAPAYIEDFNRSNLQAIGAKNDMRHGIDAHYQLIKSGKYHVFSGTCRHLLDEYEMYHYPEMGDITTNKDVKESNPVKQHDHLMDCVKMLALHTTRPEATKAILPVSEQRAAKTLREVYDNVRRPSDHEYYERWN